MNSSLFILHSSLHLFLNIWLLQTIALALVLKQEEEGDDNSNHAKASKYGHRLCIIDDSVGTCVSLVHLTDPYWNESQSNILDIEDEGVCSS